MRALKILGFLVCLVLVAGVVMIFLGSRLPHAHTASASADIAAPQAKVWQLLTDTASQPAWRKSLRSVTPLPSRDGHPCWQENNSAGRMPMCEVAATEPNSRVVRIADPNLPFGGEWIYQLTPIDAGSTRILITENGTTGPAFWRFFGHYVFHEDTMIKRYEQDLQQRVTSNP